MWWSLLLPHNNQPRCQQWVVVAYQVRQALGGPEKSCNCHSLGCPEGAVVVSTSLKHVVGQPPEERLCRRHWADLDSGRCSLKGIMYNKCVPWGYWKYSYSSQDWVRVGFASVREVIKVEPACFKASMFSPRSDIRFNCHQTVRQLLNFTVALRHTAFLVINKWEGWKNGSYMVLFILE